MRALAIVAGGILSLILIAGCKTDPERTSRALRATSNALDFSASRHVPGTSLAKGAGLFNQTLDEAFAIRRFLDKLANSDDPVGFVLTRALCTGMNQLAKRDAEEGGASDQEWAQFLVEEVQILQPGIALSVIQQWVTSFTTTAQLSQVSPAVARQYVQQCVLRPK